MGLLRRLLGGAATEFTPERMYDLRGGGYFLNRGVENYRDDIARPRRPLEGRHGR
jgi:hypothetical protein